MTEVGLVGNLADLLEGHGVLGRSSQGRVEFDEVTRWNVLPLVFGLLPRQTIARGSLYEPLKPHIRSHIAQVGFESENLLVDCLKAVGDQIWQVVHGRQLRKAGVASVRASGDYDLLVGHQRGRCAVCGVDISADSDVQLDHRLPWLLVGDPVDGSNWQLLCPPCNRGKSAYVSALQMREAYNWIPRQHLTLVAESEGALDDSIPLTLRYAVLAILGSCSTCGRTPSEAALHVRLASLSALPVMDHAVIVCEHCTSSAEGSPEDG